MGNASEGYTLVEVGGIDEDSTANCYDAKCANDRLTIRAKLASWMTRLDDMTDRDARHAAIAKEEKAVQEDADLLEEKDWNRSRKMMKAKQYKKGSQQSY